MQQFFLFDRYLNTYKKYQDLLNNKAETEINAFIQDEPVLLALSKVLFFFYPECCFDIIKCEDMVYYSGTVSFLSSITPMSVDIIQVQSGTVSFLSSITPMSVVVGYM